MVFFLKRKKASDERRRFKRFDFWFNASIWKEKTSKINQIACKNLSEGGMLFTVKNPYDVSTICYIELDLPMLQEKLLLKGVVLRCENNAATQEYEIALSFVKVAEEKLQIIRRIKSLYS